MTSALIYDAEYTPPAEVIGGLYVIEIGSDRIKVGWSRAPQARLRTHRSVAHAHGVTTGREWVTPRRATKYTETALIDFCAARATEQVAREYFLGVSFGDAAQRAAELTNYTRDHLSVSVYSGSANAKYSIDGVADLLSTTEDSVRDLVAAGGLEFRDPDELPLWITRRALLNWLNTEPDLFALPRAS